MVDRLLSAGTILLGKTNLHEFAYGCTNINPHYGPARNSWDPGRVPGGSSGGIPGYDPRGKGDVHKSPIAPNRLSFSLAELPKVFPVLVIKKNRFPFDSSNHHLMQRSWSV